MSTILQIAHADRHLSTLMKGIKSTDIEEILNDLGPFTLFAPVNLAFSNLGNLSWDELLKPANKSKLADLLSYHILKGKKLFGDFSNGQILTMVNGKDVSVLIKDDAVYINGAKILSRDRQGNNGVIHSVDAVNVPANPLYKV